MQPSLMKCRPEALQEVVLVLVDVACILKFPLGSAVPFNYFNPLCVLVLAIAFVLTIVLVLSGSSLRGQLRDFLVDWSGPLLRVGDN